jgi:uncharacterized protein (DUF362 family)
VHRISRRSFLAGSLGVAAGVTLAPGVLTAAPAVEPLLASDFPSVVVARGNDRDQPADYLQTAIAALGGLSRFVLPGQSVVVKPNATWDYPPGTASSTDPLLLRALIQMLKAAGAKKITVVDHCTLSSAADCLRVSGIGDAIADLGVDQVFADRDLAPREYWSEIALPNAKIADFRKRGVLKVALTADVRINMGVAKSHLVTRATMCLKHMMGFLESPSALHAQLEQGIADINSESPIRAHLHILEAIRVRLPVGNARQAGGDETEVTHPRRIKRMNQVLVGIDPVLIDAYGCSAFFGFQPAELMHVKLAAADGHGEMDVALAEKEGRFVTVIVGALPATPTATITPSPSPSPTSEETSQAVIGTPTVTRVPPTVTPLPTSTPEAVILAQAAAPTQDSSRRDRREELVLNPNGVLNGALLPVAAIVAGSTLVARRQLERRAPAESSEQPPRAPESPSAELAGREAAPEPPDGE